MRVGLVIYGSIEILTGGCLYDRRLLDHLVSRGDRAEVISLPRRNHYPRALCDNASPSLVRRLTRARFDVLLQDALVHPSLVFLNGWLRAKGSLPDRHDRSPIARPEPPACRELALSLAPALAPTSA